MSDLAITFLDDVSQVPVRRSEPGMPTCHSSRQRACPVYKTHNGIRTQVGLKCEFVVNDLWYVPRSIFWPGRRRCMMADISAVIGLAVGARQTTATALRAKTARK